MADQSGHSGPWDVTYMKVARQPGRITGCFLEMSDDSAHHTQIMKPRIGGQYQSALLTAAEPFDKTIKQCCTQLLKSRRFVIEDCQILEEALVHIRNQGLSGLCCFIAAPDDNHFGKRRCQLRRI